jgi:hypothetical protein
LNAETAARNAELAMSIQAILAPLFVQVVLTLAIGFWLAGVRSKTLLRREVHPRDIALDQPNWPVHATQLGNSFRNQFELPVLFYVLTVLAIITRQADLLFVVLAWAFVLTRLAHAFVHVTSNRVQIRGSLYLVGAVVLAVMWAIFMVRFLLSLP